MKQILKQLNLESLKTFYLGENLGETEIFNENSTLLEAKLSLFKLKT